MNMSDDIKSALIRQCAIRHGDTETANLWARDIARKLIENKPLDAAESAFLATALLGYVDRGEAAKLFNHGKMPHKSNRLGEDIKFYKKVREYVDSGKKRSDAIEQAGEDLDYPKSIDDDWMGTAISRYDQVRKTLKQLREEVQERQAWQEAFDEAFPPK